MGLYVMLFSTSLILFKSYFLQVKNKFIQRIRLKHFISCCFTLIPLLQTLLKY